MHEALTTYFQGEKNAGLLLTGMAIAALLAAGVLVRQRFDLRSFAVTLGVLALVELGIGVGLYLRTGPQVDRLLDQLRSDPEAFRAAEGARMARVQRNFATIEYVELALILAGALIAVTQKTRPTLTGVALAILVQASALLAFDLVAERRGAAYLSVLGPR